MTHWTGRPAKIFLPALFAASVLTTASLPLTAAEQDRLQDRYRILVERNVFRRDRGSVRSYPIATTRPQRKMFRSTSIR